MARVLVIDDNPDMRELMRLILEGRVTPSSSPRTARPGCMRSASSPPISSELLQTIRDVLH